MNEEDTSEDWDRFADDYEAKIALRHLPFEPPPWDPDYEEPLNLAAVFEALVAIRNGKSRQLKSLQHQPFPEKFHPENREVVDRPPNRAVRMITQALQAGPEGFRLIKQALALKPQAKGVILARFFARKMTKPKGGWPKTDDEFEKFDRDAVEWIKPSKQEVEHALREGFPNIYKLIAKKDGAAAGLKAEFWEDAALKDVLNQQR
jgi:hypothetical protein